MSALVFDLGGTHLRAAVASADGFLTSVVKERIASVADGLTAPEVWSGVASRFLDYIRQHGSECDPSDPIVLSVPGPINASGRVLSAPTLVGAMTDIPDIRADLESLSGRPVRILNDLSAAAWSLSRSVHGRFLVVTVSSGIGSKIFDPRIGVLDNLAFAGEIGHGIVDESADAPVCDCGGRGHLGAIASGRGIERLARKRSRADPDAFALSACARQFGATQDTLRNEKHLVPALRRGDPWAMDIVRHCSRYLARVLVSSILVAGLASVVIIGGFALAVGDAYLAILRTAVREFCDYELLRESIAARLTLGSVGEETCLCGAAFYASTIGDT